MSGSLGDAMVTGLEPDPRRRGLQRARRRGEGWPGRSIPKVVVLRSRWRDQPKEGVDDRRVFVKESQS
jgi:hypothetical protein